jgi:hypothetical protein
LKRLLALATDDESDVRTLLVGRRREARIVPASHDVRLGTKRPQKPRNLQCGRALKRHHRQADDVGLQLANQPFNRLFDAGLHQDQVGDRHAVVRIDVAGERGERAVRHPDGDGRHVFERIRHREQQDVHDPTPRREDRYGLVTV